MLAIGKVVENKAVLCTAKSVKLYKYPRGQCGTVPVHMYMYLTFNLFKVYTVLENPRMCGKQTWQDIHVYNSEKLHTRLTAH